MTSGPSGSRRRPATGTCGNAAPGPGPEVDLRPGALGQLAVAAHEVGVEVRLDDVPDLEALRARLVEVLVDVPARIHDRGLAVRPDQVGRLGEAAEVELLEVHGRVSAVSSQRTAL